MLNAKGRGTFHGKAALAVALVLWAAALGFQGRALSSHPGKGTPDTFIRLDSFTKTYPPGETPAPWKARKQLPIFGSGDRTFYHFVHEGEDKHYIHLASGKDNWFSVGYDDRFNPADWPVLEWEWKITKLPEGGDVRVAEKDDQAGSICLITGLGTFGYDTALCYLYENAGPKNVLIPHPRRDDTAFYFLRTGAEDGVGKWFRERRNMMQDYLEAFKKPPKEKGVIILQIDSNTLKTTSEAFYRNIYQRKQ